MREIQTKSGKILCVEVPDDTLNWQSLNITLDWSKHKIVGKLSELTDKDCEEFVDRLKDNIVIGYEKIFKDYHPRDPWFYNHAKQSFISLLKSEGVETSKEYLIIKVL